MEEIYKKLNYYLNEICKYLKKENVFLLDNIRKISIDNDKCLYFLENYNLDNKTIQNHLTFEDVYNLTREIIATIDDSYLEDFDKLIESGKLDFNYESEYHDSSCITEYENGEAIKQIININREFNYNDVFTLIHEFIHYTNGKKKSKNRNYFTEFLSIYFELYAIEYLLKKGVSKEEIDYLDRIKITEKRSNSLYEYEIILVAYIELGSFDENTLLLLQQYVVKIDKELFEKKVNTIYKRLSKIEMQNEAVIKENPDLLGEILSQEFIERDYKYILGTLLAFYALKYCNFTDIVNLNNQINELNDKNVIEICSQIGINLNDKNFLQNVFASIDEYIVSKEISHKKGA